MKRKIRTWFIRLILLCLILVGFLFALIMHPDLLYKNKTKHKNLTIFHNEHIDSAVIVSLEEAAEQLKLSTFYNPNQQLDICLNDGSNYPTLIRALRGKAFAWGFYNKVVLQGEANFKNNYAELHGYRWNMKQLLTHEMIHCLQYDALGFWNSNPVANIPNWKWEGYAEYIARQQVDQKNLTENIKLWMSVNKQDWAIKFTDQTITSTTYYKYWIMVQYCMDVEKMTYEQLLSDTTSEQKKGDQMIHWYEKQPQG